jgi:phosphate binding protein
MHRLVFVLTLVALLVGACGSTPAPLTDSTALVADGKLTPVIPERVRGTVLISGSSTVYPLTLRMARQFRDAGSDARVIVTSVGTGAGFRAFCGGAALDVVNASRPISEEEAATCRANGRDPLAFQVGTDALSVVVSAANPFVQQLSFEQLRRIFSGEARRWQEVDPGFPDAPIRIFSPGADSGTFDFFVGHVLDGNADVLRTLPGAVFSEDDEVLRRAITADPYAIGYFGYAYYRTARSKLRALEIDAGAGPIAPSQATAISGAYPLARPLFIYSSHNIVREKPTVAAFLSYYVQYVDLHIDDVGYFPAAAPTIAQSQATLVDTLQ